MVRTMTTPAPTLLVVAGPPGGVTLVLELARTLGHQVAPPGPDASRLGGWFGTGDRVVVAEPRLADTLGAYAAAADRLGASLPVLVVVDHPALSVDPATWLEATLGAVTATRTHPRAVVRTEDLHEDWQAALSRVDKESGSRLIAGATLAELDDADDVVRGWPVPARVPWPDSVDPALRDLAARAWVGLASVADGRGDLDFLDALRAEALTLL
jgi:hypothetical protein